MRRHLLIAASCLMLMGAEGGGCVLSGPVYGWGENDQGQLGRGETSFGSSRPARVGDITGVVQVSASHVYGHGLALTKDGEVYGWGRNDYGQAGNSTYGEPRLIAGLEDIVAIDAGGLHSMALDESGRVWMWGDNRGGVLGIGSTASAIRTPTLVAGLSGIQAISAGQYNSVAVRADGTVIEWGSRVAADGSSVVSTTPVVVPGLAGVESVSSGAYHNLALETDGSVWAWGYNGDFALGVPSIELATTTPVRVSGVSSVSRIAASWADSFAVTESGSLYAWGRNQMGEHGDGSFGEPHDTPQRVPTISGVRDVSAAGIHVLALNHAGHVYAWGFNYHGELGDGVAVPNDVWPPPAHELIPRRVYLPVHALSISAGTGFSLASGMTPLVNLVKENEPVLWIHGYEGSGCSGINLQSKWRAAIEHFRDQGWTAPHYVVSYYECDEPWLDTDMDVSTIDLNGGEPDKCAHDEYHASGHIDDTECTTLRAHTTQTKIDHLAYHLAWELYARFTRQGKRVRIMAHSMGGLITRSALLQVEKGNPSFPPSLSVSAVGTFGTPHEGGNFASFCNFLPCVTQVEQMKPGDGFLNDLGDRLPTSARVGGTRWWLYGSEDDNMVPLGSAVGPQGGGTVEYESGQAIEHDDLFDVPETAEDYTCRVNGGDWRDDCPDPMRYAASVTLQQ